MSSLMDDLNNKLAEMMANSLTAEQKQRVVALQCVRTIRPDADSGDLVSLAHYILTGSGEFPTVEELQRIEVRNMAGETTVHYLPEAETVVGVVTPDENALDPGTLPDLSGATPAPTEGEGWRGRSG